MQLRPMEEHYKKFRVRAGIPTAMTDAIESSSLKAYDALVEVCDYWLRKCRKKILHQLGELLQKYFL